MNELFIPDPRVQCRFGARLDLASIMLRRFSFMRTARTLLFAAPLIVSLSLHAQCPLSLPILRRASWRCPARYRFSRIPPAIVPRYSLCNAVKQQQVIKTGADGYGKFQVSDGSVFEVFPNTELVFRKTFNLDDLLNVWLGKVKVYIQHLPGIPNPNNVITPTALISVRGTVFDVDVEDLDGTTFISLDEGIIDVRHLPAWAPRSCA